MLAPPNGSGEPIMNKSHSRAGTAFLVSLLAIAPAARSDSPCHADYRDTTPAERAQITGVLKAMQGALPPAPEGWIIVVDPANEISVPDRICRDTEKTPWNYGFTRTYKQVEGVDARVNLIEDQAARQQAAMEQRKPRLDAAQAKYQKITNQINELSQKKDYAGAEKLAPQLRAAEKEYEAILNEAFDPAAVAATDKAVNRDFEMTISVYANPRLESVGEGAKAIAPPARAKSAQRWHVETETESTDRALYLFGAWTADASGKWRGGSRAGASPTAAHAISVLVSGDPARVTSTVPTIKFPTFEAAVK
jgi:hypothetical protein